MSGSLLKHIVRLCLVGALGLLVLGGCRIQVQYPSETPSEQVIVEERTYWLWGLIGETSYEAYDLCTEGRVYELSHDATWRQGLIAVGTLGIYCPRTITITCSDRGGSRHETGSRRLTLYCVSAFSGRCSQKSPGAALPPTRPQTSGAVPFFPKGHTPASVPHT